MRLVLLPIALAIAAPAAAHPAGGPFTVAETGRSFAHLDDALASLGGGNGTIRIAPGRYRDCAVQESGSVAYVAEVPGKAVFDRAICEGKASLVLRGRSAKVDGLVFMHTFVPDGNGAGIRIEKGDLTVENAMFLDGQSGILSASDPDSSITIDHSTFAGLGKDPTGNGAHSIYIGDYGLLTVTNSRFERGTGGHYLKCRAPVVTILDNSFDDSQGSHTNYMIDLSNGASGRIAGNSFLQGAGKDNYSTMISVAPEGAKNSSEGLVIEDNRAWLAPAFEHSTTFVGNWSNDRVTVRGNELANRIKPEAAR
ncbi:right-handed parallel beta-helix repeat-containing protein [Stakelama marina]|uniref:Right-handed parallel beta-helix repeat-containing protein n=1 Tax=Stakelama marina TaxID=2826939 RepID=A0A8T4IIU2_9SPHN|nr:right-handed parallel beta-helix repeat-containing protein [Stakelama marina]MBR0553794.1 right-handed parallel beta-helix repeat-containing protein [Stakelama marina]